MDDHKIIELQLDRKIDNFLETALYCPFGFPAVITVKPFANNTAAPTIYWLSCPYLNYEVGRLEAESDLISELGKKLKTDMEFKVLMEAAHQRYAEKRKNYYQLQNYKKPGKYLRIYTECLLNQVSVGLEKKKVLNVCILILPIF